MNAGREPRLARRLGVLSDQPGPSMRQVLGEAVVVLRLIRCAAIGHLFDGQFCTRCGWWLP